MLTEHAFVLRYFSANPRVPADNESCEDDRLVIVNLGGDSVFDPVAEPLLAPPSRRDVDDPMVERGSSVRRRRRHDVRSGRSMAPRTPLDHSACPAAAMMELVRRLSHPSESSACGREWLVTNGLGGYASGTLSGSVSRRYHGLLVAALSAPAGRMVMLTHMHAWTRLPSGRIVALDVAPVPVAGAPDVASPASMTLSEFRLELGLPVWRYEDEGVVIEKRVVMPYRQNTVHLTYRLLESSAPLRVDLRPFMNIRHYDSPLRALSHAYTLTATQARFEISAGPDLPVLRLLVHGYQSTLTLDASDVLSGYREEQTRGYDHSGALWSPGYFHIYLDATDRPEGTLVASTEPWETIAALAPPAALESEQARRAQLLQAVPADLQTGLGAELVIAADQFIVTPAARPEDAARAQALGTEARTIIAGYHWFTDWGRDTMISLEGLTLITRRQREAALILLTFANYVRDGLIPNMFPDGERGGLYHTADATLWYFQAIERYLAVTHDSHILGTLLPTLQDIIARHLRVRASASASTPPTACCDKAIASFR